LDDGAHVVVARGCEQQCFRVRPQQLAHAGQQEMANDFSPWRSARLACDDGTQLCSVEALGEHSDLGGLPRSLAALKGDEPSAPGNSFDRCLGHGQSFSSLARNIPMTSSLTPSIARRIVDPVPIASAAKTGVSSARLPPRQIRTTPMLWPASIGARTGPL